MEIVSFESRVSRQGPLVATLSTCIFHGLQGLPNWIPLGSRTFLSPGHVLLVTEVARSSRVCSARTPVPSTGVKVYQCKVCVHEYKVGVHAAWGMREANRVMKAGVIFQFPIFFMPFAIKRRTLPFWVSSMGKTELITKFRICLHSFCIYVPYIACHLCEYIVFISSLFGS